ncbi:hypothetical protein [Variovorax sp. YR634]|uniref:hypothetical protein n=1 Tax=Variovorax sp. YR634 TaxID=1884385 RepID=UPI000B8714DF|nr:hypothetical protein [Variovorax sp. YR634]
MTTRQGRIFFFSFGAVLAIVGGLMWHWGEPAGLWTLGLAGCACIAVSAVLSDALFEKTIKFLGLFW